MNELTALEMTGYLHPDYAMSLGEFGSPRQLPRCGGWILERAIAESDRRDAMGCYPLFACQDWHSLEADLNDLAKELVSLCLVADPFGQHDQTLLKKCFPDLFLPFKEHFATELNAPIEKIASKHHRYYARKALQVVKVERCSSPADYLDDWTDLYTNLIRRHELTGIKAFSRCAFERQLQLPGVVLFRAVHKNATVGAHIWFVQGGVAYSHLAAFNDVGYELMAAYALYWTALQTFAADVQWLDIGSGAGTESLGDQGLTRFKRGWATGTKSAYLCGRIFNREAYDDLTNKRNTAGTAYFPAYRQNELA